MPIRLLVQYSIKVPEDTNIRSYEPPRLSEWIRCNTAYQSIHDNVTFEHDDKELKTRYYMAHIALRDLRTLIRHCDLRTVDDSRIERTILPSLILRHLTGYSTATIWVSSPNKTIDTNTARRVLKACARYARKHKETTMAPDSRIVGYVDLTPSVFNTPEGVESVNKALDAIDTANARAAQLLEQLYNRVGRQGFLYLLNRHVSEDEATDSADEIQLAVENVTKCANNLLITMSNRKKG